MVQLTLQDLNAETIVKLRNRAVRHGRSLEEEIKLILQQVAEIEEADSTNKKLAAWAKVDQVRQSLSGQIFSDSVELLREDRHR